MTSEGRSPWRCTGRVSDRPVREVPEQLLRERAVPPGWDRFSAFVGDHEHGDLLRLPDAGGRPRRRRGEAFGSAASDYSTTVIADDALAFLRARPNRSRSSCTWHPSPRTARHSGSSATSARSRRIGRCSVRASTRQTSRTSRRTCAGLPFLPESEMRLRFQLDYETLQAVDRMVGRIVDELRRSGQAPRHRDHLHVGQRRGVRRTPMGLQARAVRGVPPSAHHRPVRSDDAAVVSGSISNALVSNVDVAPTIADIAGVRFDGVGIVDGVSIAPLLTGAARAVRSSVLLEHIDFPGQVPHPLVLRSPNEGMGLRPLPGRVRGAVPPIERSLRAEEHREDGDRAAGQAARRDTGALSAAPSGLPLVRCA